MRLGAHPWKGYPQENQNFEVQGLFWHKWCQPLLFPGSLIASSIVEENYFEKCMDHLNNGPYQLLKKDPAMKVKAKTLNQLKVLMGNQFIDSKLYYLKPINYIIYLKPTDSHAPRFYHQSKIHNPGVPIPAIVSYSGSPWYSFNKCIANILKAYVLKMKITAPKILPRFPTTSEMC